MPDLEHVRERGMAARSRDQNVKVRQKITETWEVEYQRRHVGGQVEVRLSWPHHTVYCGAGYGETVEEARLDLVRVLAKAVAEDPNPFGDS